MVREILMPKLGLTMVEGTIIQWFVKEGNHVNVGDKLFEVETDKLTNEITADTEGLIRKIFVGQGETAEVKALIGIIADEGEDISILTGEAKEEIKTEEVEETKVDTKEETKENKPASKNESGYILATPYAKKIAAERGIDLTLIAATGYNGVVVAKDVENAETEEVKVKVTPTARKIAEEKGINLKDIYSGTRIRKADVLAIDNEEEALEELDTERASGIRRITAQRMKANWAGTPMVTFNVEVDMTELISLREKLKPIYVKEGLKLTYNHIIMKILSKLLVKYRYLNASFENDTIIYHKNVNLGIAVDVERGLMVPNVKGIEKMTLREISEETERLIEEAKTNKLNPDCLSGGTFTITNIGMFGMDSFTPIINKPEVAILGINRIADKPVALNKQVVIRPMMNLSLTTDHSLVDGVLSAKFLNEIKEIIENPYLLID
ncbi:MAG: dihydrolipoamide acetyltransferase family protein [Sedimentibacter sp.]|uniref:dihydrolipoamide acetyltransferase family protein n=1 Tax=Sedimentibacter sp. TaxID=1960295 RepID=UPI002981F96C|nr:dihydrolipoamide acetyltransferase family protein [Sedimentibacter sp.]MDW5299232.1 dihydrolipoamide acetyltransferase family protein [Sedimentibacter sp.]